MTKKPKQKKEKVTIAGQEYKVEETVAITLKALSDALHAHEVALLTWVHKEYEAEKLSTKDLESFRKSFREYCMQIPGSENILKRMKEIDEQMKKDIKEKQNKKEKVKGAKE